MVGERVVLRRVEHFQQRRRRVAPEIRADLVQFVQQNDRIPALNAAQRLNDPSGHRAHISAPVAANFRLIAHAAERDAGELAPQRVRHAFAERGFADAGRADQAENRAFDLLAALDDGDEFDQPVLDLGQAEMLLVQNFLGGLQIQLVLGGFLPGHVQNPVEIISADGVFGGGGRRLLQAFKLLLGGFARLVGHGRLLDFFPQQLGFIAARFAFAQFTLDGADLFAQEKIALRLGDGGRDVVLNFGTERQHLLLAVEHGQQLLEALADGNGFQQLLPVFQAEIQVRGDEVGEMAGMLGVERGDFHLVRKRVGHLGDVLELLVRVAEHGLQFDGILGLVPEQFIAGAQIRRGRCVLLDADAPQTLDQHARGAVGKLHHFGQARNAADFIQVLRRRLDDLRFALQHRGEQAVAGDNVINQFQARPGFDQQRHHRAGENDDVRHSEDGQVFRQRARRDVRRRLRFFGAA